jgi:hypothetical protein
MVYAGGAIQKTDILSVCISNGRLGLRLIIQKHLKTGHPKPGNIRKPDTFVSTYQMFPFSYVRLRQLFSAIKWHLKTSPVFKW